MIINKITPNTALLQLLLGLSFCDISPPHFPQHRQQQKQSPTIGIIKQKRTPIPTHITIPMAYPKITYNHKSENKWSQILNYNNVFAIHLAKMLVVVC